MGSFSDSYSSSDTCNKETSNKQNTLSNVNNDNFNVENDSVNANQKNLESSEVNNTTNNFVIKASSENFKTNVRVHNPPGGKSTFSLY
ncbi:uncharacterized protein cubi_01554 [Cryptosporidium ubiquitum]|uniref:Uncharacterized protein n=1 Tax=Cryptosporidium ubiquitum TaxID=857276 RepID=A0A1J4MHA3_9CRYT|nr:uncharacterized protein cubi_01554 [Cryptosporidium ubiquitum]OII72221.1 hypothetical protein cubi_01554 [Cryptosporidium ubiquitum]